MIGDSNDETIFSHELLLSKAFANNSSANIKLSKKSTIQDDKVRRIFTF